MVIYTILEISSAGKLTIIILSKSQYGCEIEFYSNKIWLFSWIFLINLPFSHLISFTLDSSLSNMFANHVYFCSSVFCCFYLIYMWTPSYITIYFSKIWIVMAAKNSISLFYFLPSYWSFRFFIVFKIIISQQQTQNSDFISRYFPRPS